MMTSAVLLCALLALLLGRATHAQSTTAAATASSATPSTTAAPTTTTTTSATTTSTSTSTTGQRPTAAGGSSTASQTTSATLTAVVPDLTDGVGADDEGVAAIFRSGEVQRDRNDNTPAVDVDLNNNSGLLAWVWLVIVVVICAVLFAVACFYILVYFQHEEDKNTAWAPKIVLTRDSFDSDWWRAIFAQLVGMWLAMVTILLLPLDIANASTGNNLPMDILWQVVLFTAVIWTLLVIPFFQLYYESEDPTDKSNSQLGQALKVMIIGGIVFVVLAAVGYLLLGVVNIPIHELQCGLIEANSPIGSTNGVPSGVLFAEADETLQWRVSIVLFLISMLTLVGTFFMACFGGIGLTALPLDLINEFRFRPTRLTLEQYARVKLDIGERATKLIEIGKQIQEEQRMRKKRGRQQRATFNRFKQNVYLLDEDWRKLNDAHKNRAGRIMWSYIQLALGLFGTLLSILWVLQVVLFVLPRTPGTGIPTPVFDILGDFFFWLDRATALPIATFFYALFAFYLLACVMKGNFKFGLRFVIFTIHPMRIGSTMLNSFLFNVGLILLTSISLVQFCTNAFIEYAQFATAAELFGVAVQNLRYIEYFYYFYAVGIVALAVLTLLYLLACPSDRRVKSDD